jgi:hypothetical protein
MTKLPQNLVDRLDLPPQKTAPLFFYEEIGYNQDNEPITKPHSYFRDNLLRLCLIRTRCKMVARA